MGPALMPSEAAACAQCLVQRIVIESGCGEDLFCLLQDAVRQGCIALLRNQVGRVIRRQLGKKEKIGGGDSIAQELDALADQRGDSEHLFWRWMKAGLLEEGLQAATQLSTGRARMCSALSHTALAIEGIVLCEIHDRIGAVDAFERERGSESRPRP